MKYFLLFYFFLWLIAGLWGQEQTTIQLNEGETVYQLQKSENYLSVVTKNEKNRQSLYLYDTHGHLIFQESNLLTRVKFHKPIEKTGAFVYAIGQVNAHNPYVMDQDLVCAISLRTGELIWQTESIGSSYELSPDKDKLLTNSLMIDNPAKHNFEIVDVKTGDNIRQMRFGFGYHATWFSDDRILFLSQEYDKSINPKYRKYAKVDSVRTAYIEGRMRLRSYFSQGKCSQSEFETKLDSIENMIAQLENKRRSFYGTGRLGGPPRKWKYHDKTLKLKFFALGSDSFNTEKHIYGNDGTKFLVVTTDLKGMLSVDMEKNIYIKCTKEHKDFNSMHYIIKLDSNLNILWEYHIDHPFRVVRLLSAKEILFAFRRQNANFYFLDKDKHVLPEDHFQKIDLGTTYKDISQIFNCHSMEIFPKVNLNLNLNRITIMK